jgi:hypothetical protein
MTPPVHPSARGAKPAPFADTTVGLLSARPAAKGSLRYFFDTNDGSLYFDAAVGIWTLVNSPDTELAFAQNIGGTGATTVATSGSVGTELPNCFITVEPCQRPVFLEARATFQQITAAAVGSAFLYIWEVNNTTGALMTNLCSFSAAFPNSITGNGKYCDVVGKYRLGPVLTERSFMLTGITSGPAAQVLGTAFNPSWIGAFAA